ncbi:connector enhancer of kinase suppressor of ras 2-like isoform X1 [Lates japonicus]|uniref:Connector enhancer of kinase suppressor of ras 2-like isoform X1 n=1 Tax=Lates japonicus TaxID=270547 RepID=A0AAD3M4S5_LATJO|nr:connector enhancer of kinase suppressor of ras 2-like isoform X1 [Lates japonicus]
MSSSINGGQFPGDLGQGTLRLAMEKKGLLAVFFKWKKYWFILKDTCLYWVHMSEESEYDHFTDNKSQHWALFMMWCLIPSPLFVWDEKAEGFVNLQVSALWNRVAISPLYVPVVLLMKSSTLSLRKAATATTTSPLGRRQAAMRNSWQDQMETTRGCTTSDVSMEKSLLSEDETSWRWSTQAVHPAGTSAACCKNNEPCLCPSKPMSIQIRRKLTQFPLPRDPARLHAILAATRAVTGSERDPALLARTRPETGHGRDCRMQADSLGDLYRALEQTVCPPQLTTDQ